MKSVNNMLTQSRDYEHKEEPSTDVPAKRILYQ